LIAFALSTFACWFKSDLISIHFQPLRELIS
jgi:hypothetical protein